MEKMNGATKGVEKHGKAKRRDERRALADMNLVVPCLALCAQTEPFYGNCRTRRPAVGVAPTLRIYWLQNWFNLLDAPTEEALYAMTSTREFVSIDLDHKPAPDEETTPRVNLHDYPVTKPSFCDGL